MSDPIKYIKTTSANLESLPIVNGQVIALTDTDGLYYDLDNVRHVAGSGASSSTLGGLSDVTLTSLADGQFITYDAQSEEWINATVFGNETISYDDFNQLSPEEKNNGTAYYIYDAGSTGGGGGGGGGASSFADLTDVQLSNLQNGQVPKYNSATQKWENANESGGGSTYTAGDGIDITDDTISVDEMPDTDMEEIITPLPSVMSRRFKYSTSEQVVGEWIDGKPIYQKTIECGALPNNTTKNVAHGITNASKFISVSAYTTNGTNYMFLNHPYEYFANVICNATNVMLRTNTNLSAYTETYVTIQYTKTSD